MPRVHNHPAPLLAALVSAVLLLAACQAAAAPTSDGPAPSEATPTDAIAAPSSPTATATAAAAPVATATASPPPTAIATPPPTPVAAPPPVATPPSTPSPAPSSTPAVTSSPTPTPAPAFDLEAAETQMLALVNQARAAQGLAPLAPDNHLKSIARTHSADMAARDYFAHVNPDGLSPMDRLVAAGYEFTLMGENLALYSSTVGAHEGLMDSPGHRANILREGFGRIGIGIHFEGEYEIYFTQLFAN